MKLNEKLIKIYFENGKSARDKDVKLYFYWNAFLKLCEENRADTDGLRAGIRRYIEENVEDIEKDIDFEDFRLDIFYERPVFEDLRVEEDKDVYYYEDFNTNKPSRANDDYFMSIKNFQRILEDSDLISMFMSIFKVYNCLLSFVDDNYSERENRLIEGSIYLLECALANIVL